MSKHPQSAVRHTRRSFVGLSIGTLAAGAIGSRLPSPAAEAGAGIALGSRRELFVDNFLVDRLSGGAELRLHAPQPGEVVLTMDRPWEGIYSGYFTVIKDNKRYRAYYRGLPVARHTLDAEVTCCAESADGIHWTKPRLGLFEVQGTRENNVILARHRACHNFAPMLDTNPNARPDERYKALGGTGGPGLLALVSSDGVRWRDLQREPVITRGAFDSQNIAFWSEAEGCYVCYFRVFVDNMRWIARSTSADFRHWSEPVNLGLDGKPRQHLYTNQLFPYPRAPHIYLGLPTRFMGGRRALNAEQLASIGTPKEWHYGNDCVDITLLSTRGGEVLKRTFLEAFIRPGRDLRQWTSRSNYAAHGIFANGADEISFYVEHHCGYPSVHLRRYTMRADGFASLAASLAGGELRTKPLTFTGNRLTINMATSAAGGLRVEMQSADGRPLPGYALADCPEIIGDQIERIVTWKGGADVGALAGKPVRLRIALADADLYALRFARV